ncbi:hypothetical protein ACMD2_21260 [Ananas comosus]|uniref:Uncharacterized protein n=1 Tax=Ananas comosus TaxID=4615 RepID=A0A199V0V9_ANACO|nr:hypothetical protein ACMD2_21260 [Ananas comosus]
MHSFALRCYAWNASEGMHGASSTARLAVPSRGWRRLLLEDVQRVYQGSLPP